MNNEGEKRSSQPQPAPFGGSPRPPTSAARGSRGRPPGDPGKTVYLLDRVLVKDLAGAIGKRPFQVVADLLELKQFKQADEEIDFETASLVARKHGYRAERPPPGVLVL